MASMMHAARHGMGLADVQVLASGRSNCAAPAVADSAMKRSIFNPMVLIFSDARRVEFGHAP
jgi:hypothetical protein